MKEQRTSSGKKDVKEQPKGKIVKGKDQGTLPPLAEGERRILISTTRGITFQGFADAMQMLGFVDLYCNPATIKQNIAAWINQAPTQPQARPRRR